MKRFATVLTALVLVLLLSACGEIDVGVPDVMATGQLVVAYDVDTQVIVLEPGACTPIPSYDGDGEVLQGVEGVGARAYYGLEPGDYCLTWGVRDVPAEGEWMTVGNMPFTAQPGALDFISVVPDPPQEEPAAQ